MPDEPKTEWRGEYPVSVDSKYRLGIKPQLKDILGNEFIVVRGPGNCIYMFQQQEWEKFFAELREANNYYLLQVMGSSETPTRLDGQNRLVIPKFLRDWSGLKPGTSAS